MNLERRIVDVLRVGCAVETWFGAQPQGDDESPANLPVVIINRPDVQWLNDFCGLDLSLGIAVMQVDYWAETAEQSRRLADKGRVLMASLTSADTGGYPYCPTLQMEESLYDPTGRAWRWLQRWNVPDYDPVLSPVMLVK